MAASVSPAASPPSRRRHSDSSRRHDHRKPRACPSPSPSSDRDADRRSRASPPDPYRDSKPSEANGLPKSTRDEDRPPRRARVSDDEKEDDRRRRRSRVSDDEKEDGRRRRRSRVSDDDEEENRRRQRSRASDDERDDRRSKRDRDRDSRRHRHRSPSSESRSSPDDRRSRRHRRDESSRRRDGRRLRDEDRDREERRRSPERKEKKEPTPPLPPPPPLLPEMIPGRTGGIYIPPFRMAQMMREVEDKASPEYQRLSWDALKKSINGLVNKVNATNIKNIVPELFAENLVRGRGLFCQSCIKSQMASPGFTDVFAALVAVVNTKFPEIGRLFLVRVVLQLKRAYKRNDKPQLLAATKFIAHLVNQVVAHELVALELLTVLLENPTDDSVEVAVGFVKECGAMLQDLSPQGLHELIGITLRKDLLDMGNTASPRWSFGMWRNIAGGKPAGAPDGLNAPSAIIITTWHAPSTDPIVGEERAGTALRASLERSVAAMSSSSTNRSTKKWQVQVLHPPRPCMIQRPIQTEG